MRRDMLRRRQQLHAAAPNAGDVVARIAIERALGQDDDIVALYWPMGEELDARPLVQILLRQGRAVALPATPPKGAPLTFRRFTPETTLRPGPFKTSEPPAAAPALTPKVVFAPLLAFDGAGRRLGYGGGYYDRTLQSLRAAGPVKAYGLAYAGQEVSRTPTDALDEPLDGVVTERGFRQFARD